MYPSPEYKLLNISAITTIEVTDGKKYVERKNSLNFTNWLFIAVAKSKAKVVVIGTVPKENIKVFVKAL